MPRVNYPLPLECVQQTESVDSEENVSELVQRRLHRLLHWTILEGLVCA